MLPTFSYLNKVLCIRGKISNTIKKLPPPQQKKIIFANKQKNCLFFVLFACVLEGANPYKL